MSLTNDAATAIIIILLTPVINMVISLAKQENWPKQITMLLSVAFSAIGGVGIVFLTGGFQGLPQPTDYIAVASTVYAASQVVYASVFKDSPPDKTLAGLDLFSMFKRDKPEEKKTV